MGEKHNQLRVASTRWPVSVLIIGAVIVGLSVDTGFLRNIALGLAWIQIVLGLCCGCLMLGGGPAGEELRRLWSDRSVWRKRTMRILDVPIILLLAGQGHWITFALYVVRSLVLVAAEDRAAREAGAQPDASDDYDGHWPPAPKAPPPPPARPRSE